MNSAALKRSVYAVTVGAGRLARVGQVRGLPDRPGTLRVLMYHKVTATKPNSIAVHPSAFAEQQAYLGESYNVVSLRQVDGFFHEGAPLPPRAVLITFDDAYLDNIVTAYPILKRAGHRAVMFVPTGFVGGRPLPHDRALTSRNPTADWDDLAAVLDVFDIGSHGHSHRPLASLDVATATDEAVHSKRELEDRLGVAVEAFAYPKGSIGDFGRQHEALLRSAGYRLIFTTLPGQNGRRTSPSRIKRHNVEDYGMSYFRGLLDGSADLLALKDTRAGYRLKKRVKTALAR